MSKSTRSWVPYIAQGVTNTAHFAATNIGKVAMGEYAALGLSTAQFVLKLREQHEQIEELAKEVNEAIHYMDSVVKWTARVHTCDTDRINEFMEQMWVNIRTNYLNSTSFLQRLIDTDRRAMALLAETRDDPDPQRRKILGERMMEDTFLNMWPEYYRNDLLGRMTRLVEMVKTSMIEALTKGREVATGPSACTARTTLPSLRVDDAPLEAIDEFVANVAVSQGGRRASRKTSKIFNRKKKK
jgi:hypothetical protein